MTTRIDHDEKEVTLYLRDYLSPGGLYPYDCLTEHCEHWLKEGYRVCVLSVPGFVMFTGNPKYKKAWSVLSMGKFKTFKTAYEAMKY